jgi:hypothetical protein
MASPFSIVRFMGSSLTDADLREQVRKHTECEDEVASILRSIERLGTDESIRRYEMTPTRRRAYSGPVTRTGWSVRAVRTQ